MMGINYKKKEELIKNINNGRIQAEIYDYLTELQEINGLINKDEVYEYFDAEFDDVGFINWEMISNPRNEIELLLHNLIANVYIRFNEDRILKNLPEVNYTMKNK